MSDLELLENLSILKNIAKKYDEGFNPGPLKPVGGAPCTPVRSPSTASPVKPGGSASSHEKRPPWRPVRGIHTAVLDPQHLTPSRKDERPASPGRRPFIVTGTDDRAERRAAQCLASGEGLRAAELRTEATFTIIVREEDGSMTRTGGERVRCFFRGRSAPELQLTDMGDGSYVGQYIANVSGSYELHAMLDGKVCPYLSARK